ncbi:hypothetical protein BDY21DRAFT_373714 [Lineolata rhizophorae]|uniref:Mid2 domain-containing protein n=1 Tax=Lineolata rhizophorae TaxID=578093 RepID=A0A6A6NTQ4_9PEZI|nr:hypothetical protein BDY21DRAFT_373714 [Lineolata rhizophorae]
MHSMAVVLPASATNPTSLFQPRQDPSLCGGNDDFAQCEGDLPADFCCPADSSCLRLNAPDGILSVLCCPDGQDCDIIRPITCDPVQQNATLHPTNQVHSDDTDIELQTCGDRCCPLGYNCDGDLCIRVDNPAPSPTEQPSSGADAPTATSSSQPTNALGDSPEEDSDESGGGPSGRVIAAIVVPSLLGGALLLFLGQFLWRKYKASRKPRYSGDWGPVSRSVSDPIYQPQMSDRADFLLRRSSGGGGGGGNGGSTAPGSRSTADPERPANSGYQYEHEMNAVHGGGGTSSGGLGVAITFADQPHPAHQHHQQYAQQAQPPTTPPPQQDMPRGLFSRTPSSTSHAPPPYLRSEFEPSTAATTQDPFATPPRQQQQHRHHQPTGNTPPARSLTRRPTLTRNGPLGPTRNGSNASARERSHRPGHPARNGSQETIDVQLMTSQALEQSPLDRIRGLGGAGGRRSSNGGAGQAVGGGVGGSTNPGGLMPPPPIAEARGSGRSSFLSQHTTFTTLMENAGFKREETL